MCDEKQGNNNIWALSTKNKQTKTPSSGARQTTKEEGSKEEDKEGAEKKEVKKRIKKEVM